MSILLLHLTDAHVRVGDAAFADRAKMIVAAAMSPVMGTSEVHLVLSGDMVQSGQKGEYDIVNRLIVDISDEIELRGLPRPKVVMVPGNHDCDFSGDQSVRNIILDGITKRPAEVTAPVAAQMRSVLANFDSHREVNNPDGISRVNPWVFTCTFDGEVRVQYVLIDSSVMSQRTEQQGKLFVQIPDRSCLGLDADRVVYVMHHPFGWLAPDNARELAQFAAATGDLFLMGHEHVHWSERVSDLYTNATIHYLRGHALQDSHKAENSAFQTVELCKGRGFLVRKFELDRGAYRLNAEDSQESFKSWSNESRVHGLSYSDAGYQALADAGANFSHRRKAVITLPDIYIWPDVKPSNTVRDSAGVLMSAESESTEDLLARGGDGKIIIIRGGEQFGKSALARMLALGINKNDAFALLLSARDISSWRERKLENRLDEAIDALYGRSVRENYRQLPRNKKKIIIDDFDLLDLARHGYEGLKALRSTFGTLILLIDSVPGLDVALSELLNDEEFAGADVLDLQPFNYHQRLELIERWLSIGQDAATDEHELRTLAARLGKVVDETLGRNFIPSVPLFVLVILQRAELEQDLNTVVKSGSHGFLYELLITQALSSGVRVCTLDTALTYLSSLAMHMYESGGDSLAESAYARFHLNHCERYDLGLSLKVMESQLTSSEIIIEEGGRISFKYPYHYYYFLARQLAAIQDWAVLGPHVRSLAEELHTERAANVLLFLAHLGRNPNIAKFLLDRADAMLASYEQATLFIRGGAIAQFSVPEIRQMLIEDSRARAVEDVIADERLAEAAQRHVQSASKEKLNARLDDALAMNAAFKTLQVLGQLLRNHAGSMEKNEKRRVADACVAIGLRTLGFLYDLIEHHGAELVAVRGAQLAREFPRKRAQDIAEDLESYLPGLVSGITVGTLIKIANAVGSEELSPTLESVLNGDATRKLIKLVTELEHFSDFPEDAVMDFKKSEIKPADVLAFSVLRRFIVRRFQLFPVRKELRDNVRGEFQISARPFLLLEQSVNARRAQ
jgi:hypothetical protein